MNDAARERDRTGDAEDGFRRIGSGNAEIDSILGGGFPGNSINIVMGQPGTGKTVFAEQLIFANAGDDRPILYLTTLSEPLSKVVRYLQDFEFFDENKLGTSIIHEDLGPELARAGIESVVPRLKELIRTHSPKIIVIDSFKALNDLTHDSGTLRWLVYEVTGLFSAYETTAFLLGEYSESDISRFPEFACADGIVELSRRALGTRDERFFRVFKLRGSKYMEGVHAFRITSHGLEVFPRLVSPSIPTEYTPSRERVSTGVPGLDEMLGGGLWRGTSTLLVGPAGSGKTTLALQFVFEGARLGEAALYLNLQENPSQLARTVERLTEDVRDTAPKLVEFMYVSPVELQIDRVMVEAFRRIKSSGAKRVVIDALNDLGVSASDSQRFHNYLYALVQHLIVDQVTFIMTVQAEGSSHAGAALQIGSISALSDNYVEIGREGAEVTRRSVRVLKTRGSAHDLRVREIEITANGVSLT
jgi:circadian clock protein KaiC